MCFCDNIVRIHFPNICTHRNSHQSWISILLLFFFTVSLFYTFFHSFFFIFFFNFRSIFFSISCLRLNIIFSFPYFSHSHTLVIHNQNICLQNKLNFIPSNHLPISIYVTYTLPFLYLPMEYRTRHTHTYTATYYSNTVMWKKVILFTPKNGDRFSTTLLLFVLGVFFFGWTIDCICGIEIIGILNY